MPWHLGKNMCPNSHKFAMQYGKFYAQLSIWRVQSTIEKKPITPT